MFGILDNLDFTLIYMSLNALLFIYGIYLVRYLIQKNVEGKKYQKYIFFVLIIVIIAQIISIPFISGISILKNQDFRSFVTLFLILWSYAEFDRVILKSFKPILIKE